VTYFNKKADEKTRLLKVKSINLDRFIAWQINTLVLSPNEFHQLDAILSENRLLSIANTKVKDLL
jgi:hypothetical protein